MDMIDTLRAAFHQQFGDQEELRYFSPQAESI